MKMCCDLKCSVTPHSSLNTSKGIVCCPALSKETNDHIKEFMAEQGVTDVRRITVRRDGIRKPNKFVLTFNSPNLTTVVKIGLLQVNVDESNPFRCYNCQVFGHHKNKYDRHAISCNCGEPEHCGPSGVCEKTAKCVNCSGDHHAICKQSKLRCEDQESIKSSTTTDRPRTTNGKVTNSQWDTTNERQVVSPFPAGDHKAHKTDARNLTLNSDVDQDTYSRYLVCMKDP